MSPIPQIPQSSAEKAASAPLCEYDLELTYPLTVVNCLPFDLGYKLSQLTPSMINEPDSFSRVALSRLGNFV